MLDATTKAKIDSARDILVGKVPDPKSQVEQITIALIYKFMDDMDRQSEELGGKATFFTGEFKKYRWSQLLDKRYGGHERLLLYAEGIEKMNENKNIPQLFRDIFKGVFLPYRDPETLNLFLKEIDGFSYDHSERLGDAFEYLLSVLGTQGDAGQFRTPRHIIDFIVAVVDPKKNDTVLDPACGTAGFLISAYKHILSKNENLSPDERARLMTNFRGYDIAPDMVRLARANMYLHGFPNPTIHEYDALTSEERWDERCDVILANPPFMTPTGGIRPHNRFAVRAGKSEVLFVDYIIEHLLPGGRAGVIVPEGILENHGRLNSQLRKMAVENGLFAIISLPVGVFQPYSGNIKTSILFLDKARQSSARNILHLRIHSDGYELGRQRRPTQQNDLPWAFDAIEQFMSSGMSNTKHIGHDQRASVLRSDELLASRDCYLTPNSTCNAQDHWRVLGELFDVTKGTLQSSKNEPGPYTFITAADEWKTHKSYTHDCEALLFAMGASGSLGRTHYFKGKFVTSDLCFVLTPKRGGKYPVNMRYYHSFFCLSRETIVGALARGAAKKAINMRNFKEMRIPYCPIELQNQLVEEIARRNETIKEEQAAIDMHRGVIAREEAAIREMIMKSCDA
jgi:type I restriction enzyme M protein